MCIQLEQAQSLAYALEAARVQHGDRVEVTMAVGVLQLTGGRSLIAFCPVELKVHRVLKNAGDDAHKERIQGEVVIDNPTDVEPFIRHKIGIALLRRAHIETNGSMHLWVPPEGIVVKPVKRLEEYVLNHWSGHRLAARALALCY